MEARTSPTQLLRYVREVEVTKIFDSLRYLIVPALWAFIAWAMSRQTEAGAKSLRRLGFWVGTVLMGIAFLFGILMFMSPFPGWIVGIVYWLIIVLVYRAILKKLVAKQLI